MSYQQQPSGPYSPSVPPQQQQQQPFLPPWYRVPSPAQPSAQQDPGQYNSSALPPQQPPYGASNGTYNGSWGGSSNGSNASSSTGYSSNPPAGNQPRRTHSPNPYQRPNTPGRGNGGSWGSGYGGASGGVQGQGSSGYKSGYGYGGASGGRGYGQGAGKAYGVSGRGRGSPSPQRAPSPPVWIKEGPWLVPKPGSVEAAAHAAAVAQYRQQQRQQQQEDPVAAAADAVAATAGGVAAVAAAASDDGDCIDLTADDTAARGNNQLPGSQAAVAAAAAGTSSPSKADVIDLTGQATFALPTTATAQQLSGLQLLLQQHRQQPQQQPQQQTQAPQQQSQQQQQQQQAPLSRVVYIMRGLPGAGKSTRATEIAAAAQAAATASGSSSSSNSVPPAAIHSTDSFFVDPVSGVYNFDVELLSVNHQKNFDAFCASLAAGVGTVIVDNTNIQPWQFEKYVQQAWSSGYRVREEVVGEFTPSAVQLYAQRNVHGVPLDKLQLMLEQWQRQ